MHLFSHGVGDPAAVTLLPFTGARHIERRLEWKLEPRQVVAGAQGVEDALVGRVDPRPAKAGHYVLIRDEQQIRHEPRQRLRSPGRTSEAPAAGRFVVAVQLEDAT